MKIHTFLPQIRITTAIAALLIVGATVPTTPVRAQPQSSLQIRIDSCDTTDYPSVTCIVLPSEGSGVPSRGLPSDAFEVFIDESIKAADVSVEEFDAADSVRTDTMLLIDFGMTQGGRAIDSLRQVTRRIVENARDTDNIGFIAVMGKVDLGDTLNPPLNEAQESDFRSVLEGRNYIINIVNSLDPKPKTPLYDALCKALILTAKRKVGARAVVVLSDGNDKNASASCEADDPIARANKDRVPVFSVAVGNNLNAGYLSRLAIQTNGVYLVAGDFDQGAQRYEEIQTILRTRYRIKFTSPVEADAAAHKIHIRLNVPAGRAEDVISLKTLAPFPVLESLVINDQRLPPNSEMVLPSNDVAVEALFSGQPVKRVEFELQTTTETIKTQAMEAPWRLQLRAKDLDGVKKATLTIRVYGKDEKNFGKYTYIVLPAAPLPVRSEQVNSTAAISSSGNVSDTTQTTVAPEKSAGSQWDALRQRIMEPPMLYVLIALGVLIAVAVGVAIVYVVRRRSRLGQRSTELVSLVTRDFTETGVIGVSIDDDRDDSLVNIADSVDSGLERGKTVVVGVGAFPLDATQIRLAWLRITSGDTEGAQYELFSQTQRVVIGRSFEGHVPDIDLKSSQVSRTHASITCQDNVLYLKNETDKEKTTRVDGVQLEKGDSIPLKPGMTLKFGDVTAVIEAS